MRRRREYQPRHRRGLAWWEQIETLPLWAQPPLLGYAHRETWKAARAYAAYTPRRRSA